MNNRKRIPLVMGGQGRTNKDLRNDADNLVFCGFAAIALFAVLAVANNWSTHADTNASRGTSAVTSR